MISKDEVTSILTIDDLAEYLKISKSTLYKLAQAGQVPGQKVGRHWRFRREAIDRWLDLSSRSSVTGTPEGSGRSGSEPEVSQHPGIPRSGAEQGHMGDQRGPE